MIYARVSSSIVGNGAPVYIVAKDRALLDSLIVPGSRIEEITQKEFGQGSEPHEPDEYSGWLRLPESPTTDPQIITLGIEGALQVQPSPTEKKGAASEDEPHFGARDQDLYIEK